jgi:hypothetical protein
VASMPSWSVAIRVFVSRPGLNRVGAFLELLACDGSRLALAAKRSAERLVQPTPGTNDPGGVCRSGCPSPVRTPMAACPALWWSTFDSGRRPRRRTSGVAAMDQLTSRRRIAGPGRCVDEAQGQKVAGERCPVVRSAVGMRPTSCGWCATTQPSLLGRPGSSGSQGSSNASFGLQPDVPACRIGGHSIHAAMSEAYVVTATAPRDGQLSVDTLCRALHDGLLGVRASDGNQTHVASLEGVSEPTCAARSSGTVLSEQA